MTKLLLRLFVKNYENSTDMAVRTSVGKLAGATGIVCNIILFLMKLLAGLLAGSVAIIADAVNNLSDASSSVVTLLGFRLAQMPADEDHPYGHARYEYLSGLMVAVLILVIGVELVKSSVGKIIHPEAIDFSLITVGILVASVLVKLWMSLFFGTLGKRINSLTLQATSVDSRNDVVSTIAVLAGCLVGYIFHVNIDGYVGLLVALFILYSGVNIVRETISPLLGEQADEELVEKIKMLVYSHEAVLNVHDLLIHDYGPGRCFASIHAEVSARLDPMEVHDILDEIECAVLDKLNVHLVIHYDPVLPDDDEWAEMSGLMGDILSDVAPEVSMHCFRMVGGAKQKNLVFDLMVPYDSKKTNTELKREIDQKLLARNKHYGTIIRFDGKE
ncbi:MAG: cation transporter [Anaerotignum sp.]|nr:cation transporter [Anaerotignum sp.]